MLKLFLLLLAVPAAARPPRLVAIVIVDQMRADYVSDARRRYQDGFARLEREGAVFTQARHDHVPTQTPTGHAALATGRFPDEHGITGMSWWDHERNAWRPALSDEQGRVSPEALRAETLADALKKKSPDSKVVAVSGKERGAVPMGGLRADLVLWNDKDAGRFVTSAYYPKPPAWLERFNEQNQVEPERRKTLGPHPHFDQLILSLARTAV
ncbi:MAG: alkaline phosphatase family protein, partial [Elusimicrobia bacterium]|nr:alkaline phosphatase family protein [Elusimicrobiota bacterium]